jgi:hypothetical protein
VLPDGICIFIPNPRILVFFVRPGKLLYLLRPFGIPTLWPFVLCNKLQLDTLCGHFLYFPNFGKLYQQKSGNPDLHFSILGHSSNYLGVKAVLNGLFKVLQNMVSQCLKSGYKDLQIRSFYNSRSWLLRC